MRDAYSNLLGEYVAASEVDYPDIVGFQIVCPCCREPIFKVRRELASTVTDFFSHHSTAASQIAECERRVGGISAEARAETDSASRGQSLQVFRSVVRDAVSRIPLRGETLREKELPQIFEFQKAADTVANFLRMADDHQLRGLNQTHNELMEDEGCTDLTPFDSKLRARISADLLRTIVADQSFRSLYYLSARAFIRCHERKNGGWRVVGRASAIHDHYTQISLEHGGIDAMLEDVGIGCGGYLVDAVLHELYRLPYFKMITNSKSGRPPLSDITEQDYLPERQFKLNPVPLRDRNGAQSRPSFS